MTLRYTVAQEEAIAHRDGNLLILACAGSGKTEVISRRIATLVRDGVNKNEVVAFTFTERAADALKARIRRHLEEVVPDDPALGDMYVGTIHSFCLQILKEIDPTYRNYEVMDEDRQAALIMSNYYYNDNIGRGIGLNRLQSRTKSGTYWNAVRAFVSTLSVIHQQNIDVCMLDEDLRVAIERYRNIAYEGPNYFFDYDEIITKLLTRLKTDAAVLDGLRNQFKYLIVDEYQDVDDRQEELIQLLSDSGSQVFLTVVGDDDQSIYGWRGTKAENIIHFERRYPDVTKVELLYNFRSTHAIVDIANRSIRGKVSERIAKDMQARHFDPLLNTHTEIMADKGDIQLRTFCTDEEEADWVADRIKQLRGTIVKENETERAIDYSDMAILLRSVKSSGADFVDALRRKDIPVIVKGTGGLFEQDEIKLVQAVFCLLSRSSLYLDRNILEEREIRNFVRAQVEKLVSNCSLPNATPAVLLEWVASKREELDKRDLEKDKRGRLARRIYPQDIFQELLNVLGASASETPLQQGVLFNFGKLSSLITQFEAVHQWITPYHLKALCIFLGGWASGRVDEGGIDEAATANAVQIMTVHAAKGLEWPVVFLPRISSRLFPSSQRGRGPETFLKKSIFDPKTYAGGDDGERRLWYVALTRCAKFLNVTSRDRVRNKPTPYFKEISHDVVQRDGEILLRPKGVPKTLENVELLPTSYSDLNYYWRCPFEYQLRSLMGFSPGVGESYGYGQQIHNVLAEIHKAAAEGKKTSPEDAEELMDKRFHLRYTRDGEGEYKPLTALKEAAKKTVFRYLKEYSAEMSLVLEAEKQFEFIDHKSKALITGAVDLLQKVEHQSGQVKKVPVGIVDFKTHGWNRIDEFKMVRDDASTQLQLYTVAVKEALGLDTKKAKAFFLSQQPPSSELVSEGAAEQVDVDISPKAQQAVKEKVREAVQGIRDSVDRHSFDMTGCDKGRCRKCDFRVICPGFNRWKKIDKNSIRPGTPEEERTREMQLIVGEK